jgi:hypothetical protein
MSYFSDIGKILFRLMKACSHPLTVFAQAHKDTKKTDSSSRKQGLIL